MSVVAGNHFDKYRSANPVHRFLVGNFLRTARELLAKVSYGSVLEAGCGEGDLAHFLFDEEQSGDGLSANYLGIDVSGEVIALAKSRYPDKSFQQGDICDLPLADESYDMVIACEVFEHLHEPEKALLEVHRVSKSYLLLSVPWEPVWRALNCLRGKYWKQWGNTPGHVQHFSRSAIRRLVHQRFEIIEERHPLPWTMLLAKRI